MTGGAAGRHGVAGIAALAALVALAAGRAGADYLVADLSDHRIAITSGFTGSEVLLFGTRSGRGDVVVVLRGPKAPSVVWRKLRTLGMWLNRVQVRFDDAPGYYAVAASRPLDRLAPAKLLEDNEIGFANLRLAASRVDPRANLADFREALLRSMERARLYRAAISEVVFIDDILFRATFAFPANVPTGLYNAHVYLIDDGVLVSKRTAELEISKTGFEAAMFRFANHQPLAYGLVAVLVAVVAGWSGGMMFRGR